MTDASQMPAAAGPTGPRPAIAPWLLWAALALVLLAFPSVADGYYIYLACLVLVNIIATVGLNITVGYTGLLSIGHSAFIGVGAYTCAVLWSAGVPVILSIVAAGIAAFAVGTVFGLPALRIRGVYLAIATLAAQYCLYFIFVRWTAVTGGDHGMNTPMTEVLGYRFDSDAKLYYLILPFTVLSCLAAANLFRSRIGRAFIAVRERDYAAQVLGINVVRTKLLGFGIGAALAGVTGALTVLFLRSVTPDQFTLQQSVFFLTAVIVGGRGSITGSILGAAFMTLVPELLRGGVGLFFEDPSRYASLLAPARELIFGALIILFLLLDPRGLAGLLRAAGLKVDYRG